MAGDFDDSPGQREMMPVKRRKIRKGTRSCWECKRRKIKCIYASSEHAICINCERRRLPCVNQDLPEDLAPAREGNRHLHARISKVEDLMKDYLAGRAVGTTTSRTEEQVRQHSRPTHDMTGIPADIFVRAPLTPAESLLGLTAPTTSLLTPDSQVAPGDSGQYEFDAVVRHLRAAFPSDKDTQILLRESCRPSLFNELVNTRPHSKLEDEVFAAAYPVPKQPGPNAHPVTLAKLMLIFAITLQSPSGETFPDLSEPPTVLMRRLAKAAITWVTTNEEMHGSVDCLVCIILEGKYEMSCGNLRRAWVAYRRAITVAQLMGLHRSPTPPLKRIDPELNAVPEFLWFRIVHMDRYLSLLLGLPQGTPDKSMGAESVLRHEPPLGRFERQITVVASRILERDETTFSATELAVTQAIDAELLSVSKSMPASFWRPVSFDGLVLGSPDTLMEVMRLSSQVFYFGLLIQLHLPYMKWAGHNTEHEYSKITCVNASREIMTRFIVHRSFHPMSCCSRPVDFWALLASMTLMLAHLDAHNHRGAVNFLAHQRLSDRALLGQALEQMDAITSNDKDVAMEESAKLIRRLLDIEADAAEGSSYTTRRVRGDGAGVEESKKEGDELRLHIPYLGIIRIAREGPVSRDPLLERAAASQRQSIPSDMGTQKKSMATPADDMLSMNGQPYDQSMIHYPDACDMISPPHGSVGFPPLAAGIDDWAFQGVDMAFFDSLMRGASNSEGDATTLEQQWIEDPLGMGSGHAQQGSPT